MSTLCVTSRLLLISDRSCIMILYTVTYVYVFVSCNCPTTFDDSVSVEDEDDDDGCDDSCKDSGQPLEIHSTHNIARLQQVRTIAN